MKNMLNSIIFSHIKINRFKYLAALIFLFTGIIAGAIFCSNSFDLYDKSQFFNNITLAHKQDNASFANIFIHSFIQNIRAFILIWISGRLIWLIPLNYIELLSKGFGLGYTISFFSLSCGSKGFVFAILSLIVQSIVMIPALLVFSVSQMNYSVHKYKLRGSNSAFRHKRKLLQNDFYHICVVIFAVIVCGLIDAFIIPYITTPMCESLF